MTLIKSISGIRGTIGGQISENLTPIDIVKFTSAYGIWNRKQGLANNKIVVGRDARLSGQMVENIVVSTLVSLGFEVINIGMATTPTTEMAVILEKAAGGIIITASHNPKMERTETPQLPRRISHRQGRQGCARNCRIGRLHLQRHRPSWQRLSP